MPRGKAMNPPQRDVRALADYTLVEVQLNRSPASFARTWLGRSIQMHEQGKNADELDALGV